MRRRPNSVLTVARNILGPILFFGLLLYLWEHGAIPLYMKTSVLTILGGAFVLVFGQVVQKGYIEPIQELQKTIGEITSAVLVYSNTADAYTDQELQQEARRTLRKLSGDLLGRKRVIGHYSLFAKMEIVPTEDAIKKAARGLIGMSNSVGSQSFDVFSKSQDLVRQALWIDALD